MPGGRPTKYDPKYCQEMLDYFDRNPTEKKNGKEEAVDFPSVAGFARRVGTAKSTIYEWARQHPEFSNVLTQCKAIQEEILLANALKGGYHAGFTQFLLKNTHGFEDKKQVEQSQEISVNITKDEQGL